MKLYVIIFGLTFCVCLIIEFRFVCIIYSKSVEKYIEREKIKSKEKKENNTSTELILQDVRVLKLI